MKAELERLQTYAAEVEKLRGQLRELYATEPSTRSDADDDRIHELQLKLVVLETERRQYAEDHGFGGTPAFKADYSQDGRRDGATGYELRSGETVASRWPTPTGANLVTLDQILRGAAGVGGREARDAISGLAGGDGSVLLPSFIAAPILDAAFEQSALVRAGARRIVMKARTHKVPRVTSDPTLAWRAELGAVTEEKEPGIGAATLTAKTVAGVAVISWEELEDVEGVGPAVVASLGRAVARAIDAAALAEAAAPVANGPVTLFADTNITEATAEFEAAPYTWDCLIDIAAELAAAEAGELDFVILPHGDIAGLRKLKASTAGSWLGKPAGLENVGLVGSAQMSATSGHVLAGSDASAIAIGMMPSDMQIRVLTERYAVSQSYGGDTIGGASGFLVWCRADVVAADPIRLLRVPTDRTP